jgi:hypothetical protein
MLRCTVLRAKVLRVFSLAQRGSWQLAGFKSATIYQCVGGFRVSGVSLVGKSKREGAREGGFDSGWVLQGVTACRCSLPSAATPSPHADGYAVLTQSAQS